MTNLKIVVANFGHCLCSKFAFWVIDQPGSQDFQLYCLCLKMTADFVNFVNKTDEKRKTKDEMNPAVANFSLICLFVFN